MNCPLCKTPDSKKFSTVKTKPWPERTFYNCENCKLIFVSPADYPTPELEKEIYNKHNNDPKDPRYRDFLNRLMEPLLSKLTAGSHGLDFGSGPGPTLHLMLEEKGFKMSHYDLYYAKNDDLLLSTYDFITCTETAEHFHNPRSEFEQLNKLLKPNGWLGIMTEFYTDQDFHGWHYIRDPTHVCIYRQETMEWLASFFGWRIEIPRKNVALFGKP